MQVPPIVDAPGLRRVRAARETVADLEGKARAMGITRVADVTGLDHVGIPVVMVCRPNSRSLAVAQGKGVSLAAAKASGLMESIEQHHAERVARPVELATHDEIRRRHAVVDVDQLPRCSTSQFHEHLRIPWIESCDLATGERIWVPYELVHLDLTVPMPSGGGCFPLDSNGLASGNHLFEAFVHGICEVVERDAATLWKYLPAAQRSATALDLATVDDEVCGALLERFAAASIDVRAWELTTEIGIPVVYARIYDSDPDPWRAELVAGGCGAHPRRDLALMRALLEAAQSRLTLIAGSRDDLEIAPERGHEAKEDEVDPGRDFYRLPHFAGASLADDLEWLLDRLLGSGFRHVLGVDLTLPEFGIPVVRIVIPGLEPPCDVPSYLPGPRLRRRLEDQRRGAGR